MTSVSRSRAPVDGAALNSGAVPFGGAASVESAVPSGSAVPKKSLTPFRRVQLENGIVRHEPAVEAPGDAASEDWDRVVRLILEKASDLGFIRAGVASLDAFDEPTRRLEAFIAAGRDGTMRYLSHRQADGTLTRADPHFLFPDARAAIVVALPYAFEGRSEDNARAKVAHYARGDDYHIVLREKLLRLADAAASIVGHAVTTRVCVDSAPLLERDLAVRAGFAFLGKNTLAIAPGAGSHFLLGELLVDLPLPHSQAPQIHGCGSCTACLDACPTKAFVGPFELNANKCISYLTIESQEDVPKELRGPLGLHLFGCDVCQAVCPFNATATKRAGAPELKGHQALADLKPEDALTLGSAAHKKLVRGTALRRVSRNQLARNAAIVLGNRGRSSDVPLLEQEASTHPSVQVRIHCVWALGQLLHRFGVDEARMALLALTKSESEPVASEAREALIRSAR